MVRVKELPNSGVSWYLVVVARRRALERVRVLAFMVGEEGKGGRYKKRRLIGRAGVECQCLSSAFEFSLACGVVRCGAVMCCVVRAILLCANQKYRGRGAGEWKDDLMAGAEQNSLP